MRAPSVLASAVGLSAVQVAAQCVDYADYSTQRHEPFSAGRFQLSYQRPPEECRTFKSQGVEDIIARMKETISDPDLERLFENAYPSTLDTAIKWRGKAADTDEELTFIITGDINAMWLRDSSNQMQSYLPLLNASESVDSIASLFRGVINLQARYLLTAPYCNSFQPPIESGIPPAGNEGARTDMVVPIYPLDAVFECKYELDSLAAFLEVSADYHSRTNDTGFFSKYKWVETIKVVLETANAMMLPTYDPEGRVNQSPYSFTRETTRSTETLANNGLGNPVANGTGLIRSAFRPSDDSTIFQFLIPANMMFASYLSQTAEIMAQLTQPEARGLAARMRDMSTSLRTAITTHGTINHPEFGAIYAFEVDGYGSANTMDDANIPSLLSAPFLGYLERQDEVYQTTRKFILSASNPYFMRGPVINAIGGPHAGPGYAWPMAKIVQILTSDDDTEITDALGEILSSTAGLGLIHESVNSFDENDWTRQWFSWANGLFGQMILDLEVRKPHILKQSFQGTGTG